MLEYSTYTVSSCLDSSDSVDANDIVRVPGEEGGTISGPGKAQALRNLAILGLFGAKSVNDNLGLKVPNLDGIIRGSTQPVTVG